MDWALPKRAKKNRRLTGRNLVRDQAHKGILLLMADWLKEEEEFTISKIKADKAAAVLSPSLPPLPRRLLD